MLSHRIIPASAVLLAVTIGSAAAQDQTSAGKPLQLLQFAHREAKAPPAPHARAAEKPAKHVAAKHHIAKAAVAKPHKVLAAIHPHHLSAPMPEAAQPVPAPAPAAAQPGIWPAVDSTAPGSIAVPAPPAAPQNVKTEQVVSDAPNAIAADGKVAQAAPPPEVSAPEVAADAHPAAAAPALGNGAAAEPVVRAMIASPAAADSDPKSPIGSAPWLLQALAALGGALAAGIVAWFLILRRHSEPQDEEFFAESLAPGE